MGDTLSTASQDEPFRSTIVFINTVAPEQPQALKALEAILGRPLRPILLRDYRTHEPRGTKELGHALELTTDFADQRQLEQTLAPYAADILAVTCKDDASAALMKHLAPILPHLVLPKPETLEWATEKTKMRARFQAYDPTISPKFMMADDASPLTILRIERKIGYPVIVKPSGLTSSMLITVCSNREQLETALQHVTQAIANGRPGLTGARPEILVEEYLEGTYFSLDAYVGPEGQLWFNPPVYGKTGRDIGFDDCFGYMRATPTYLTDEQTQACENTAATAIKALDLRSCTCHVELLHTTRGWKIIEVGPRLGGFRHEMYEHAFGINHALNDLLVRMGSEPVIPKQPLGYAAFMQFYPRQEGALTTIHGLKTIRNLASLKRLKLIKQPGDDCLFASHGGSHALEIVLCNPQLAVLADDIHRLEQEVVVETRPRATNPAQLRLAV